MISSSGVSNLSRKLNKSNTVFWQKCCYWYCKHAQCCFMGLSSCHVLCNDCSMMVKTFPWFVARLLRLFQGLQKLTNYTISCWALAALLAVGQGRLPCIPPSLSVVRPLIRNVSLETRCRARWVAPNNWGFPLAFSLIFQTTSTWHSCLCFLMPCRQAAYSSIARHSLPKMVGGNLWQEPAT